ncbi:MAG: hypothetical protein NXI01_06600 [Gammaproteobacteria bacterium]|nr:hypothetical protein [Gammaproteobacteria bacterium]
MEKKKRAEGSGAPYAGWIQGHAFQHAMLQTMLRNIQFMNICQHHGLAQALDYYQQSQHQTSSELNHEDWMRTAANDWTQSMQQMLNTYLSQCFEFNRWVGAVSDTTATVTGLKTI